LQWLTDLVEDYFDGDINAFDGSDLKVRQAGSDFSQRAWRAMRKIRTGKVISYAELAAKIGSPAAVRAAGSACGRNAIAPMIPCHRIIRSDGTLGNYGYGLDKKSWLLRHEGAIE
jgi:methylated-DNA-[protein]-cysteine S-methyltransferase